MPAPQLLTELGSPDSPCGSSFGSNPYSSRLYARGITWTASRFFSTPASPACCCMRERRRLRFAGHFGSSFTEA